jgi:acyl-coenzyme A thioesterase PaaI-like protein
MRNSSAAPGPRLLRLWGRLSRVPGGRSLFSRLLARTVPYSGTLGARIEVLEPGHCRVGLRDRRKVRNHLGSIHAVALTNLGELAGGLAALTGIPEGIRGIVLRLETEYLVKARGRLEAEARWDPPAEDLLASDGTGETWVRTTIRDESGREVATVRALWRLGRIP